MTDEREGRWFDCEVVVDRAPGMKVAVLKGAARFVDFPDYADAAVFSAVVIGGSVEMTFELRQDSTDLSAVAARAVQVAAWVVEHAGYGSSIEVLRLAVEVA